MMEYDARPERAVLVAVLAQGADEERELAEMRELLRTAQVDVVGHARAAPREHPPAHLRRQRQAQGAEGAREGARGRGRRRPTTSSRPSQQRALEDELGMRVVDRTRVILDIFALHAHSARGQAPGRARAAGVQPPAHARHVEAPRAPRRRRRHPRPGRVAARDRPPAGAHAHLAAAAPPARAAQAARHDAPSARAQRGAERRARRLHERRQVDAPERAHRLRGLRGRPPLRDARPDDALLRLPRAHVPR